MTPSTTGLSGKITDNSTGAALSGVAVTLSSVGSVTTGSDGTYRFDGLTQTSYTLSASKSGYNSFSGSVTVDLGKENNINDISMTAIPKTALSGKITDGSLTGPGLSGVTVTLNPGNYTTTTSSDGTYRFDDLLQTSYTISASKSGYQNFSNSITVDLGISNNTYSFPMTAIVQTTSLLGTVTDNSGATLSGVTVTLSSVSSVTTGSGGTYRFDNLTQTSYTLSATKSGYQNFSTTVSVNLSLATNTYNFQMTPNNVTPPNIPITVDFNLTLANSSYIVLSFGSSAIQYKDLLYKTAVSSAYTDDVLRTAVINNGTYQDISSNEFSYSDLDDNTSYTYVSVGYDAQNRPGNLNKFQFSTKPSTSQPRVTINISSITSSAINLSATKNSYCSSYSFLSYNTNDPNLPDIFLAAVAYFNKSTNTQTSNVSGSFPRSTSTYTYIVALGYNSSGNNSGYIDVKVINNSTNTVIRSAVLNTTRSALEKVMKEYKIDKEKITKFVNK
jgi:hypothetical protein